MWMRFVPKYLKTLGAAVWVIALYDGLKTILGAVYAFPGGIAVDHWGHRKALVVFTLVSIVGYGLVWLIPHWAAVIGGSFLFLAWTCFSLPATFSLIAANLHSSRLAMGIGVQSFIKRLPIIVGPVIGGVLIDRLGVVQGVRLRLLVTLGFAGLALLIQANIREMTCNTASHDSAAKHCNIPDISFHVFRRSYNDRFRFKFRRYH